MFAVSDYNKENSVRMFRKFTILYIVSLRCVAEKDRAVATALSGFLNSALGKIITVFLWL